MQDAEFEKVKSEFGSADVTRKIEMYVSAQGLSQDQYKQLLRMFPASQLHLLEAALY